jgi:hypothetical protein
MKKVVKMVLLLVVFSFLLYVPVFADSVPDGPGNYVNGVWVKVELPDSNSPWEWVPGHWSNNSKWISGHWKQVECSSVEAVEWVPAHWGANEKWVHGYWKNVRVVEGKTWVSGHWRNGKWIPSHWKGGEIKESKSRVWISGHRNASGKWVPAHREVR